MMVIYLSNKAYKSMNSIFQHIDRKINNGKTFWSKFSSSQVSDLAHNIVYAGTLSVHNSAGMLKKKKFIITQSSLYYCPNSKSPPKKYCSVVWKTFKQFTEVHEDSERSGFSLTSGNTEVNFYPNSSLKLKKWTKYLSAICILTSLEDDYSIIQEAGQGSSARVYLAHERITQKKFAVKTINKDNFLINKRALPALMNEIEIMRALSHPRLLKLHKIYEDEDMIHLVLDWMDNGDLYERVTRRGCFTEENSQLFSKNLLEAIEYLHSKNIIHRDLKPENILMTDPKNDTEFKIADFGLAAFSTSELTLRCGSPGYAAPELLKKKPYGPKVDIFSIGVISYVLLSGRAPFYGRNIQEILVNNRDCNINFYEKHWKNISLDAVNLIIKMTEKDPNNRYSATEALAHPWMTSLKTRRLKRIQSDILTTQIALSPIHGVSDVMTEKLKTKRWSTAKIILEIATKESVNKNRHLLSTLRKLDPITSRYNVK